VIIVNVMNVGNLETLKGEEHQKKVYELLYTPESIESLDDSIVDHLLTAYGNKYGIVNLMSDLIIYGKDDVSKKAFSSIPKIEDIGLEASIYARLFEKDGKRFREKIYKVIEERSDDRLISKIIIECAYHKGDSEIAKHYTYIEKKDIRLQTLRELAGCHLHGRNFDLLRGYAESEYLKELEK